jgi:hypothetical protein
VIFLSRVFFVVAVILSPNRVLIRINMHREATRTPLVAPWGWVKDEKYNFFFP